MSVIKSVNITTKYCDRDKITLYDADENHASIETHDNTDHCDMWINKDEAVKIIKFLKLKFKL